MQKARFMIHKFYLLFFALVVFSIIPIQAQIIEIKKDVLGRLYICIWWSRGDLNPEIKYPCQINELWF